MNFNCVPDHAVKVAWELWTVHHTLQRECQESSFAGMLHFGPESPTQNHLNNNLLNYAIKPMKICARRRAIYSGWQMNIRYYSKTKSFMVDLRTCEELLSLCYMTFLSTINKGHCKHLLCKSCLAYSSTTTLFP
jgi:hypothetical protein